MADTDPKLSRYVLSNAEIVHENSHRFVDTRKLGLRKKGECCLDCGNMRRADGKNSQCKGETQIALRENYSNDELFARAENAENLIKELLAENEALRSEMLTPQVFLRLVDWLREEPIRSATAAFTAGIERQIAYALEMDVLPEIKSLRIKLANSEQENQRLRAGEYICLRCGLRKDADKPAGEVPF
ncbi:MAG: hypothetical protein PHV02_03230 [Rhodocyclaceae bacterium]|nr:hypothetical protein [Rhodocyclaceae bacterium]